MNIKTKMSAFEGIQLGAKPYVKVEKFSRLINAIVIEVVGTLNGGGAAGVTDFVEYVEVLQDTKVKLYLEPALQRKLDNIQNSTDDTLSSNFMLVPFRRIGIAGSAWGAKDIGELMVRVKLKSAGPAGSTFTTVRAYFAYTPLAEPQNRNDVFVQTVIPVSNVIGGWNKINNLPYNEIVTLTKLILDANPITEVIIKVGEREVYNLTKGAAQFGLEISPLYKKPGTLDFFPVVLDDLGDPADYIPLVEGGVRRDVTIDFFWDTTVAAAAPFSILAEGVERGSPAPIATVKV